MSPSAEDLSRLLLTLYAAPMRPELWPTFLAEFTALLGLPAAAILHQDLAKEQYSFAISSGMDPVAEGLYGQYYGQIDPWRHRFLGKAEGEIAYGDDLCTPQNLRESEFYTDYLSKYDINLCNAVATIKRPDNFELISVYRRLDADMPSSEVLATIRLIVPHIRAALQLRQQFFQVNVAVNNYAESLNALDLGVILLDTRSECLFVNNKAAELVSTNDGLYIRKGRVGAHSPASHKSLYRLVSSAIEVAMGNATAKPCGASSIIRRTGRPLVVSAFSLSPIAPVVQLAGTQAAAVVLFLKNPDDNLATLPGLLVVTYGLSPAETRLACLLLEGYSLTEAAERGHVSRETVRAQLKSIFNKTSVRRQTDLLRLLGDIAAGLHLP